MQFSIVTTNQNLVSVFFFELIMICNIVIQKSLTREYPEDWSHLIRQKQAGRRTDVKKKSNMGKNIEILRSYNNVIFCLYFIKTSYHWKNMKISEKNEKNPK